MDEWRVEEDAPQRCALKLASGGSGDQRLSRRQHADIRDLTPGAGQATTFVLAWWEGPGALLGATSPGGRHSQRDIAPGPFRRSPGLSAERVVRCRADHLFRPGWCPVAGTLWWAHRAFAMTVLPAATDRAHFSGS